MTPPTLDFTPAEPALEPEAARGSHRPHGKIARLPKTLRDQTNKLLADGKNS